MLLSMGSSCCNYTGRHSNTSYTDYVILTLVVAAVTATLCGVHVCSDEVAVTLQLLRLYVDNLT